MTCYTNTQLQTDVTECFPSCEQNILTPTKRLLKTFHLWGQRRKERKQLSQLDERLLKDMGITIYDVEQEMAKPFWRK